MWNVKREKLTLHDIMVTHMLHMLLLRSFMDMRYEHWIFLHNILVQMLFQYDVRTKC